MSVSEITSYEEFISLLKEHEKFWPDLQRILCGRGRESWLLMEAVMVNASKSASVAVPLKVTDLAIHCGLTTREVEQELADWQSQGIAAVTYKFAFRPCNLVFILPLYASWPEVSR